MFESNFNFLRLLAFLFHCCFYFLIFLFSYIIALMYTSPTD